MSINDNLLDLLECSICQHVMRDPRCLPCLHTFCLKCLESLNNSQPGSTVLCPVCRGSHGVPPNGAGDFPRNFLVGKIIEQLVENANSKTGPCISKREFCGEHKGRVLDVFCEQCGTIICLVCYTEKHKAHSITDLETLRETIRNGLMGNVADVREKIAGYEAELKSIGERKKSNLSNAEKLAREIGAKSEELKRVIEKLVDEKTAALTNKLESFKEEEERRLSMATADMEEKLKVLETFVELNEKFMNRSSVVDLIEGTNY